MVLAFGYVTAEIHVPGGQDGGVRKALADALAACESAGIGSMLASVHLDCRIRHQISIEVCAGDNWGANLAVCQQEFLEMLVATGTCSDVKVRSVPLSSLDALRSEAHKARIKREMAEI